MSPEDKVNLIKRFLMRPELREVQQGLEFLDALATEIPNIITSTLGETSVDNDGKLRFWTRTSDRDVWRLAPPIKAYKKKHSLSNESTNKNTDEAHWLCNVPHKSYIGLWSLSWQALNGQVINAPFLDLTDCNLSELPENIGALKNLVQIRLNENNLESLPDSFAELKRLRVLDLERNSFRSLPQCLTQLDKLEDLNLNRNRLRVLPEEIKRLNRLENLSLWRNQLKKLPDCLGDLNRLVHLGLEENKLSTLPESIGDLNQLVHLDVSHNPIETLPDSIIGLYRLKTIVISKKEEKLIDQINSLIPQAHIGH